jgi:hypothetical protein
MMEIWSEYLEGLKAGAKVIPIREKTAYTESGCELS